MLIIHIFFQALIWTSYVWFSSPPPPPTPTHTWRKKKERKKDHCWCRSISVHFACILDLVFWTVCLSNGSASCILMVETGMCIDSSIEVNVANVSYGYWLLCRDECHEHVLGVCVPLQRCACHELDPCFACYITCALSAWRGSCLSVCILSAAAGSNDGGPGDVPGVQQGVTSREGPYPGLHGWIERYVQRQGAGLAVGCWMGWCSSWQGWLVSHPVWLSIFKYSLTSFILDGVFFGTERGGGERERDTGTLKNASSYFTLNFFF